MENINFNLLLIGKTGAGKSSFANYLFEQDFFTTGNGKPVTEKLAYHSFMYKNFPVTVYDTVGFEPDNFSKYKPEIYQLIESKSTSVQFDIKKDIYEIDVMNGIFYVINSASARVEDTELNIIQELVSKGMNIHVILTNCSNQNEQKSQGIENLIHQKIPQVNIYRVSSVSIKKRSRERIEKFGKDKVLEAFLPKAMRISSISMLENLILHIKANKTDIHKLIKKQDFSVFNITQWEEKMESLDGKFDPEVLGDKIENLKDFYESFQIDIANKDFILTELNNIDTYLEREMEDVMPEFDTITQDLDSDSVLTNIKGIFEMAGVVFNMEEKILEMVDKAYNPIIDHITRTKTKITNM